MNSKPASVRARGLLAVILLAPVLLLAVAWTCGALYCTFPEPALRLPPALAFGVGSLLALLLLPRKRRAVEAIALGVAATLAWFLSIEPRNDRNWPPDTAAMPWAEIDGNRVTVHRVRDVDDRTTSIVGHVNAIWPGRISYTKRILMNGDAAEVAYANHLHATDLPFDEWKRRAHITAVAVAADRDPLFSRRIREGLPSMPANEPR